MVTTGINTGITNIQGTELQPKLASPKVAVFMPALNEQQTIRQNIETMYFALRYGIIQNFCLVLDGCTDQTAHIVSDFFNHSCHSEGMHIISLDNGTTATIINNGVNLGKGHSFAKVVWHLEEQKFFDDPSAVIVNVDADALDLTPTLPYRLAFELLGVDSHMLLANTREIGTSFNFGDEQYIITDAKFNGTRAMTGFALAPLREKNEIWMSVFPTGIAMEAALNCLVGSYETTSFSRQFTFAEIGKNIPTSAQIHLAKQIGGKFFLLRYGTDLVREKAGYKTLADVVIK